MSKIICGKKIGNRDRDICHEEKGHLTKCYKGFGHKAEDLLQEILKNNGCEVVKAGRYEDETMKVDFWVKDQNSKGDNCARFLPIQLTISRDTFETKCNLAREAGQKGNGFFIVVWVPDVEIDKWVMARTPEKEKISKSIYERFSAYVRGIVEMYPSLKMAKPQTMLWRFDA